MNIIDISGVYFWGVISAFITCGAFYILGKLASRLFNDGEYDFIAGVVGVAIGLVIVIFPDAWQLVANWFAEAPSDMWRRHSEKVMTNDQIGNMIFLKFIAGAMGGIGTKMAIQKLRHG